MFASYLAARKYLEGYINQSIYKRIANHESVQDPLSRMRELLRLLHNPQKQFNSIVVTGTSGKGSTAYILSSILRTAGYHTGLTISPHLQKITERMQINGKQIDDDQFIILLHSMIEPINTLSSSSYGPPTYYEILLAMAFMYFAQEHVEFAVVEVGLEGKYDGTNILEPILTVLTNISLDHTELLGDTVEKIASEAVSAIKKSNCAVTTGILQDSIRTIVERRAKAVGVRGIVSLQKDFFINDVIGDEQKTRFTFCEGETSSAHLTVNLGGLYQAENAGVAVAAALSLQKSGVQIRYADIVEGLLCVQQVPGRYESKTYQSQDIILDGAHNPAKMKALARTLTVLVPERKKIFIIAFKKDKDIKNMMESISQLADTIIFTTFHATTDMQKNASASLDEIRRLTGDRQNVSYHEYVADALDSAVAVAQTDKSIIVVTGSLYLVGEVRTLLYTADSE